MKTTAVIIGARIKRLRQILKLNQTDFAKKIGANQRYVSLWELGKRNMSLEYLIKIHEVFDISLGFFDTKETKKGILVYAKMDG